MTESPVAYAMHNRRKLSVDQQLALRTATTRLDREFGDMVGMEVIEQFLYSSYEEFAARATVRSSSAPPSVAAAESCCNCRCASWHTPSR